MRHFSVDGTLIEAWASLKSFKKKDASKKDEPPPDDRGNPSVDFHGEKRSNETHESTTDPDARLARKGTGKESRLSYSAHALIENRNGLLVDLQIDAADGRAERRNALEMLDENLPGTWRVRRSGPTCSARADSGSSTATSPAPATPPLAPSSHRMTAARTEVLDGPPRSSGTTIIPVRRAVGNGMHGGEAPRRGVT